MEDEFSIIEKLFKPLAGLCRESRSLLDDVAVLASDPDHDLVVSTDAMVAGVHFFENDPLDLVARKLLRSNISDINAKGAKPYGYQLMTAWPRGLDFESKAEFARGLRTDQTRFGLDLFGGDTITTDGPLLISMTVFGKCRKGQALSRIGAQSGDRVLVGGYIGQAYLGLKVLDGTIKDLKPNDCNELVEAFHLPEIRLDQGQIIGQFATASMDISDGLIADCDHLARVNGLNITIDLDQMPTSLAARTCIALGTHPLALASGGDDYQILCTARPEAAQSLKSCGFYDIGVCEAAPNSLEATTTVLSAGRPIDIKKRGFNHGP